VRAARGPADGWTRSLEVAEEGRSQLRRMQPDRRSHPLLHWLLLRRGAAGGNLGCETRRPSERMDLLDVRHLTCPVTEFSVFGWDLDELQELGPSSVPKFFGPNPNFFAFWHSRTKQARNFSACNFGPKSASCGRRPALRTGHGRNRSAYPRRSPHSTSNPNAYERSLSQLPNARHPYIPPPPPISRGAAQIHAVPL
jgi:hypothetical protein